MLSVNGPALIHACIDDIMIGRKVNDWSQNLSFRSSKIHLALFFWRPTTACCVHVLTCHSALEAFGASGYMPGAPWFHFDPGFFPMFKSNLTQATWYLTIKAIILLGLQKQEWMRTTMFVSAHLSMPVSSAISWVNLRFELYVVASVRIPINVDCWIANSKMHPCTMYN